MYLYMFTHPGAKLLFMGNELGQTSEWNYKSELDWHLLQFEPHAKMRECVKALCHLYKNEPALYENQFNQDGFEWTNLEHRAESVVVYRRKGKDPKDDVLIILNMTPVVRKDWYIEVKGKSSWKEILNTDSKDFYGTGDVFNPEIKCELLDKKEKKYSLKVHLPALGGIVLK
jgi:1,4-alpha-glucan branching enzyme